MRPPGSSWRLAAVTSHPVQYQAPLFQQLARHHQVDLTVFYGTDNGVATTFDPGFGVSVAWDRPLLDGYRSEFVVMKGASGARTRGNVVRSLRDGRFDAVFVHSYGTALSLQAYAGAWACGIPVLLRTESELINPRRVAVQLAKAALLRPLFKATAAFLCIGRANEAFYRHYGVPDRKMFWTPYCVDGDFLDQAAAGLNRTKAELKTDAGFGEDLPVILFSGKLIPRKRVDLLLGAVERLRGRRFGVLLVGDGPLRGVLEEHARTLPCPVRFAGFQNQTQLARYYAASDVFVLPSSQETWGLVVNEAMQFSLPAVVSDMVGAGRDLVTDGVTGFVFRDGNVDDLAAHLAALIGDPELRGRLGHEARRRVSAYNYHACVGGILEALRFVAPRPSEPARP